MADLQQNMSKEELLEVMAREDSHVEELDRLTPENYFTDLINKLSIDPEYIFDMNEVIELGLYPRLMAFIINNDGYARLKRLQDREDEESEEGGGGGLGFIGL